MKGLRFMRPEMSCMYGSLAVHEVMVRGIQTGITHGGSVANIGSGAATERIEIRLTKEQRANWETLAAANHMTIAELARTAVDYFEHQDRDALAELGRDVLASVQKRFAKRRSR
jgi:hypothetical protein